MNNIENKVRGKKITIKDAVMEIERQRESTLVSFLVAEGRIITPDDCIPLVENLESLKPKDGKIKKLDLFLYGPGGLLDAAFKYVRICQEYSNEFNVIVPLFAKSAATAICLGARQIVMTPISELGPLDPIVQHPYKPDVRVPARAIEDYFAFLRRVETDASISIDEETKKHLNQNLDPYLIGSYEGVLKASEQIAKILLSENALRGWSEEKIDEVVNKFTKYFYSHSFAIDRNMASEWGLNVVRADGELLKAINRLFAIYQSFIRQNKIVKLQGTREINRHISVLREETKPKPTSSVNLEQY